MRKICSHLRTKKWIRELKRHRVCRCGEKHPATLEFYHLDTKSKLFNIKDGFRHGKERTMAEISKCELLCCNCHRKVEYKS